MLPSPFRRWLTRLVPPPWHLRLSPSGGSAAERGWFGEQAAASFLASRGYKILVRRFATSDGEIDLICRHAAVLVFVEVKARASEDFGAPNEAVDSAKQRRIARCAMAYLKLLHPPPRFFRFDVVEVFLFDGSVPRVELIPNAFDLPAPYRY